LNYAAIFIEGLAVLPPDIVLGTKPVESL